jgi:glycosyltransferase involved in cell wall biosynthesis
MSKDKKTLIILIPGFPENEADTTCLPLQQQFVLSLEELYPQLNIIVLSFQYPYFEKKYTWHETTVISFNGQNKRGLSRLWLRRKLNRALEDIQETFEIIGLLSFWYGECAYIGKRFADKYGLKHYCWLMGQDARKNNKYPARIPLKENELIALSDFLQDEFERNYGVKADHVIPPGINAKQFHSFTTKKDIDILGAGSLISLKQYEIFVEVVAGIKKQLPGIKAVLVGNGPEKNKLQELISRSGLEKNITLTGELSYPEVLQWMQRAKVFLHTSSYEGFGVVMLEALYGGAAVISFVRPMKKEIKNWHIVATKEEMKQMVLDQLLHPLQNYQRPLQFSLEDCVKAIMQLFN